MMANLLEDLLPDAPREAGILSAAARRDVAGMLREHAERGLDSETSVRLVAAALASSTAFGLEACRWAVREFAVAMGVLVVGTVPSAMPFPGADVDTSARTAAAETATAVPAATSPSPPMGYLGSAQRLAKARWQLARLGTFRPERRATCSLRHHGGAGRSPPC